MRLVSALYNDHHPFYNLPNIDDLATVDYPEELKTGDILITHGGEDISPSLYGKERSVKCWADDRPSNRDMMEWELMKRAVELDVPIIGICRGAQMLCALAGGYLIQHIEGHGGRHPIKTYNDDILEVNSIHHQMMFPWQDTCKHVMKAWSKKKLSNVYYDSNDVVDVDVEPEFIYFPEVKGHAIQWHPEMMDGKAPATQFLLKEIIKEL